MRRVKKSKRVKRSSRYNPDTCGIHGKIFELKEDLTHLCSCYIKGARGVVIHSYSNGTAKVCFECLHTSTLPRSYLFISKFEKRFTRIPIRPPKPIFVEEFIPNSKLIKKKKTKLIPKQKSRLVPK
jgi:hypothetical protein